MKSTVSHSEGERERDTCLLVLRFNGLVTSTQHLNGLVSAALHFNGLITATLRFNGLVTGYTTVDSKNTKRTLAHSVDLQ